MNTRPDHLPGTTPTGARAQFQTGRRPWWRVIVLGVACAALGAGALKRSAFSAHLHTDSQVFFRAGWAVRTGHDPYTVIDDNGWHYIYPPLFAVAVAPLADPPPGEPREGFVPYAVSVGVWFAVSVGCVLTAVHLFALALQRGCDDSVLAALNSRDRLWWTIRAGPLLACGPDVGAALSRGQTDPLLLMLIALAAYALARSRSVLAGALVGLAACVKVFPAILLLLAARRRDWRQLMGAACGAALGLVLVPAAVMGPARAWDCTREWASRVLLPALGESANPAIDAELTGFANSDNQSIQGTLHNLVNMGTPRGQRPARPAAWVRAVHIGAGSILLGATLLACGRRRGGWEPWARGLSIVLPLGLVSIVMVMVSPVAHRHYMIYAMPAVASLVFVRASRSSRASVGAAGWAALCGYAALALVPRLVSGNTLKNLWHVRDLGIPLWVALATWAVGLAAVIRGGVQRMEASGRAADPARPRRFAGLALGGARRRSPGRESG